MKHAILTARNLYTFLVSGRNNVPFISHVNNYTLTRFWGSFLSECIPDALMEQYFPDQGKRSRCLSNLMNRSCKHSMPLKLYRALEENLDEHTLVSITIWTASVIEQKTDIMLFHDALSELEEACMAADFWLEKLAFFFRRLRPAANPKEAFHTKKLFLLAALRFTLLGFHALYGDRMLESTALKNIRVSNICSPDYIWEHATNVAPRLRGVDMSLVYEIRRQDRSAIDYPQEPEQILENLRNAKGKAEASGSCIGENCGWYIVANWLDTLISVNDRPASTSDGALQYAEIPNGTIVYVLSAPGYQGLHVSKGVWGKIIWDGTEAYIPMNLTVRIIN